MFGCWGCVYACVNVYKPHVSCDIEIIRHDIARTKLERFMYKHIPSELRPEFLALYT